VLFCGKQKARYLTRASSIHFLSYIQYTKPEQEKWTTIAEVFPVQDEQVS
jgi:hypothetical protein